MLLNSSIGANEAMNSPPLLLGKILLSYPLLPNMKNHHKVLISDKLSKELNVPFSRAQLCSKYLINTADTIFSKIIKTDRERYLYLESLK